MAMSDVQAGSQHVSKWSVPVYCLHLKEGRYYNGKDVIKEVEHGRKQSSFILPA